MASKVEIEYPLPQAIRGPSFLAGGEYDLDRAFWDKHKDDDIKIRCKLFMAGGGPDGQPVGTSDDFTVVNRADVWEVEFSGVPLVQNGVLWAYLVINGAEADQEQVQDI